MAISQPADNPRSTETSVKKPYEDAHKTIINQIDDKERAMVEFPPLPTVADMLETYNNLSTSPTTPLKKNTWEQTHNDLSRRNIFIDNSKIVMDGNTPAGEQNHPFLHVLSSPPYNLSEPNAKQCLWACSQAATAQSFIKTQPSEINNHSITKSESNTFTLIRQEDGSIQITGNKTFCLGHVDYDDGKSPILRYKLTVQSTFVPEAGFTNIQEKISPIQIMDLSEAEADIKKFQNQNLAKLQEVRRTLAEQSALSLLRKQLTAGETITPTTVDQLSASVKEQLDLEDSYEQLLGMYNQLLDEVYPGEMTLQEENTQWQEIQGDDENNLGQFNKDAKRDFHNVGVVITFGHNPASPKNGLTTTPLEHFTRDLSEFLDPSTRQSAASDEDTENEKSAEPIANTASGESTDKESSGNLVLNVTSLAGLEDKEKEHTTKMLHAMLPILQTHSALGIQQVGFLCSSTPGLEPRLDGKYQTIVDRDNNPEKKDHIAFWTEDGQLFCQKKIPLAISAVITSDSGDNFVNTPTTFDYTETLSFNTETSLWERTEQSIDNMENIDRWEFRDDKESAINHDTTPAQSVDEQDSPDGAINRKNETIRATFVEESPNGTDIIAKIAEAHEKVREKLRAFNEKRSIEHHLAKCKHSAESDSLPNPNTVSILQKAFLDIGNLQTKLQHKNEEELASLHSGIQLIALPHNTDETTLSNPPSFSPDGSNSLDNSHSPSVLKRILSITHKIFSPISGGLQAVKNFFIITLGNLFRSDPLISVSQQKEALAAIQNDQLVPNTQSISANPSKAIPKSTFDAYQQSFTKLCTVKQDQATLLAKIRAIEGNIASITQNSAAVKDTPTLSGQVNSSLPRRSEPARLSSSKKPSISPDVERLQERLKNTTTHTQNLGKARSKSAPHSKKPDRNNSHLLNNPRH